MKDRNAHPEDFSPYLDGDSADKRYEEIRLHLESCAACRREFELWKSMDALFRTGEFEIDVPPFQWARVKARFDAPQQRPAAPVRWSGLLPSSRFARGTALGLALVFAVTIAGIEYRRHRQEKQLAELVLFCESEEDRLSEARNPFRGLTEGANHENPFSVFQVQEKSNPFALRR